MLLSVLQRGRELALLRGLGATPAQVFRLVVAEAGLTFPVCLQRQWEVSRLYGMFGTPVAYLIDEHGIIAADVAVGVEPILSLLAAAMEGLPGGPAAMRAPREPAAVGR